MFGDVYNDRLGVQNTDARHGMILASPADQVLVGTVEENFLSLLEEVRWHLWTAPPR